MPAASLPARVASPHSGLVHEILPLAVILHVRVVGGEHGVKGEDLLLDGATICHLPQSRGATGECPAGPGHRSPQECPWPDPPLAPPCPSPRPSPLLMEIATQKRQTPAAARPPPPPHPLATEAAWLRLRPASLVLESKHPLTP